MGCYELRVKCIKNKGVEVSEKAWSRFGASEAVVFNVTPGQEYLVLAVCVSFDGSVAYFVDGYWWQPAELFTVLETRLTGDWRCRFLGAEQLADAPDAQLILGYPEMVDDPDHYSRLLRLLPGALKLDHQRALEMSRLETEDAVLTLVAGVIRDCSSNQVGSGCRYSAPYIVRWGESTEETDYDSLACVEADSCGTNEDVRASALVYVDGLLQESAATICETLKSSLPGIERR